MKKCFIQIIIVTIIAFILYYTIFLTHNYLHTRVSVQNFEEKILYKGEMIDKSTVYETRINKITYPLLKILFILYPIVLMGIVLKCVLRKKNN